MGRRGPISQPAAIKRLSGNPGKRPITETPRPEPKSPSCPTWLDEGAKAEWARAAPELERLGFLSQLDRAAFAAYCQSYSAWVQAETVLAEKGLVYVVGGRLRERPELELARQAQKTMLAYARELGMTPASRARLHVPLLDEDEEDEFDQWLDRRAGKILD